jgi:hypothetical protein
MNNWSLKRDFTKNYKQVCVDERQHLKPYREKKYHHEWEKQGKFCIFEHSRKQAKEYIHLNLKTLLPIEFNLHTTQGCDTSLTISSTPPPISKSNTISFQNTQSNSNLNARTNCAWTLHSLV